nr:MAG TPA: hypothetical protein [Caudoviricetes sp.]
MWGTTHELHLRSPTQHRTHPRHRLSAPPPLRGRIRRAHRHRRRQHER